MSRLSRILQDILSQNMRIQRVADKRIKLEAKNPLLSGRIWPAPHSDKGDLAAPKVPILETGYPTIRATDVAVGPGLDQ